MWHIFSQAHELVDKGGDWRSRNKLKAYEAIYCLAVRDYSKAADLFIDCVSTFESYELVDFGEFFTLHLMPLTIALTSRAFSVNFNHVSLTSTTVRLNIFIILICALY